MKNLLMLSICALLIFACKKSGNENPDGEPKYEVKFAIANFSQEVTTMSKIGSGVRAVGDTLSNHINHFKYLVVNSAGQQVVWSDFNPGTTTVSGILSLSLPVGEYVAMFIGSKKPLSGTGFTATQSGYLSVAPDSDGDDIFYKKVSFTVGQGRNYAHQVRLERIVSAFELILLDETIPEGVTNIYASWFDNRILHPEGTFSQGPIRHFDHYFERNTSGTGPVFKKVFKYIMGSSPEIKIWYNGKDGRPYWKVIPGVFVKNRKTIITGRLFGPQSADFKVTVDPIWRADTTVVFAN